MSPNSSSITTPGTSAYLPATIGAGWVQQPESTFEKRDRDNPFGAHSRTWQYRNKQSVLGIISFDYPFPEWHDLRLCYTAVGWTMDKSAMFNVQTAPDAKLECVKFEIRKPFEERGYGWFTEFDQTGRPIPIRVPDLNRSYASHPLGRTVLGRPRPLAVAGR